MVLGHAPQTNPTSSDPPSNVIMKALSTLLILLALGATTVLAGVARSARSTEDDLLTALLREIQGQESQPDPAPSPALTQGAEQYSLLYAGCHIRPDEMRISGSINLRQQTDGTLDIFVNVTGFDLTDPYFVHGLHVHESVDFSDGCTSFGDHYNPYRTNHGAKTDPADRRHLGDWGNIEEDGNGNILLVTHDWLAKLEGANNIAGRGIVIHQHHDDLGRGGTPDSLTTGNAGTRLGCCAIHYNGGYVWRNM